MRQVSLREFRTRGSKALQSVPRGETILLSGQKGPAYFLIPVEGDLALADRELRRAMAQASLRESWRYAEETGADKMTMEDIDREIAIVRAEARSRASKQPAATRRKAG
jgi:antitoxin (DNA-binding transcriptional repressor) of toxin-antitoxin stability system